MEILNVNGSDKAYQFDEFERGLISKALQAEIQNLISDRDAVKGKPEYPEKYNKVSQAIKLWAEFTP